MAPNIAVHLQALHHDGFTLLPQVLDAAPIHALRIAIDQLQPRHWDYSGLLEHYKCVFNRDPLWLPFLDLPGVIELAEVALGADCHVIGQTAWRCHPGFVGMPLHLDYQAMVLPETLLADPAFELPMQVCTAHIYLDDIDADLCPTWVVPGSHRAGRGPVAGEHQWQGRAAQPVLCRAGDVLMFRSELWHAAAATLRWTARVICCKSTTVGGWWRRSFRLTCCGSSTPTCWRLRALGSGVCWASMKKRNTTEPFAAN